MSSKVYYPVNLDLNGKKCLVVGGGKVACRKARTLMAFGARVTVVSPQIDRMLAPSVRSGRIIHIHGKYHKKQLKGCCLAIAATDDPLVNRVVFKDAAVQNILVNVVDVPELCTFIVPSVVKRGPLVLGISTGGQSPMFAQKLRQQCEQCLTLAHGEFVRMLGAVRTRIKRQYATIPQRKAIHRKLMDSKILDLVLAGKEAKAKVLLYEILHEK